jgi:Leucine-rich repeat (LRR) protein
MKKIALLTLAVVLIALLSGCAGEEADETPPVISGVSASGITQTGAVITWTTDEPATSQVEYGLTASYGLTTPLDATLVTSHSLPLSDLDAGTTYHYRVKSEDASDNETVSADATFTTSIFIDQNLEAAVREAIGKPEGALLISDLEALTELEASERDIADITGLEHCTSLTTLRLSDNQIGNISPLQNLTSLTGLQLDGNEISHLTPLSNLTSLTWMYLGYNQISDVSPLSGLTSLTNLYIASNQISDVTPLSDLTSLIELGLEDDEVSDISALSGLTSLRLLGLNNNHISNITPLVNNLGLGEGDEVRLGGNPLSTESLCTLIPQLEARGVEVLHDEPQTVTFPDVNLEAAIRAGIGKPEGDVNTCDLQGLTVLPASQRNIADITGLEYCTNLTKLGLAINQISDISPLSSLTSLTELYLYGNEISDLNPLSNLTNLTNLELYDNQISDISPLSNLINLRELRLDNNQISDISVLENLTGLLSLYLDWNQISDVSALQDLTSLTHLGLFHNQISDISPLQNLTSLTDLNLSNNQIGDISALQNLTSLRSLGLTQNQISDISALANLTSLTSLWIREAEISDISPLSNMTNMTDLNLDSNQISDISPLANLTKLTVLALRDNQISDITPLENLSGPLMVKLYLGSGNQITDVSPIYHLTNVTHLDLADSQISDISFLSDFTKLEYLWLDGNQISELSSLVNLTDLEFLGLNYNQISDITPLVDNPGLGEGDEVELQGNPLSAESLNTLIPQLEARGVEVLYDQPVACIAYIYSSDTQTANSYKSLLDENDYAVALIPMGDVATVDFSVYGLIIVGPDTGSGYEWGNAASLAAIEDSEKPIIGLYYGGASLFQELGLSINWGHGGLAEEQTSIYVIDPSHTIFDSPDSIAVPENRIVELYGSPCSLHVEHAPGLSPDVTPLGRYIPDTSYYALVQEEQYMLWGFAASPESMTQVGKDLFLNVVHFMLGVS